MNVSDIVLGPDAFSMAASYQTLILAILCCSPKLGGRKRLRAHRRRHSSNLSSSGGSWWRQWYQQPAAHLPDIELEQQQQPALGTLLEAPDLLPQALTVKNHKKVRVNEQIMQIFQTLWLVASHEKKIDCGDHNHMGTVLLCGSLLLKVLWEQ